jgi:UDP-N-acetylglucosamine--N-acetylmuramyl-(pentapeptide) pyrophosphoryl-undecaprenol N-acetylglucosamine transferase
MNESVELELLKGKKFCIVASTGGHLVQAVSWHKRLQLDEASTFVTFDSPQSQSLLANHRRMYVPYVAPRAIDGVLRSIPSMLRTLKSERFDGVLSTGAGLGLAGLASAKLQRLPFYYIESVSRFEGPSLTGKLVSFTERRTFTQHSGYPAGWAYAGSLLDEYEPELALDLAPRRGLRIFVTLGTIRPYTMERLVSTVQGLLREGDSVTWQLGATPDIGLPGRVRDYMSAKEFEAECREADVVVTHAGVGSLLALLDMGKRPVVMTRRKDLREHVDDHQCQVARELATRGLIMELRPDTARDALEEVVRWKVIGPRSETREGANA